MRPGAPLYKCRLCGKIENQHHEKDFVETMTLARYLPERVLGKMPPRPRGLHSCENGDLGVSDLIGGSPDKEDAT